MCCIFVACQDSAKTRPRSPLPGRLQAVFFYFEENYQCIYLRTAAYLRPEESQDSPELCASMTWNRCSSSVRILAMQCFCLDIDEVDAGKAVCFLGRPAMWTHWAPATPRGHGRPCADRPGHTCDKQSSRSGFGRTNFLECHGDNDQFPRIAQSEKTNHQWSATNLESRASSFRDHEVGLIMGGKLNSWSYGYIIW